MRVVYGDPRVDVQRVLGVSGDLAVPSVSLLSVFVSSLNVRGGLQSDASRRGRFTLVSTSAGLHTVRHDSPTSMTTDDPTFSRPGGNGVLTPRRLGTLGHRGGFGRTDLLERLHTGVVSEVTG